jgi:hypothetical protein
MHGKTIQYLASKSMKREYDIALSFAGENRDYVEQVAVLLNFLGVRVFYDEWERSRLLGENLVEYLADIYQNKARFCAMFISRPYVQKAWPRHERTFAQARALFQDSSYILPIRLDQTACPGIAPTIGFLDAHKAPPSEVAVLLLNKLGKQLSASDIGDFYLSRTMRWRVFWNGSIRALGDFRFLYLGREFKKPYNTFSIWSPDDRPLSVRRFHARDRQGPLRARVRAQTRTSVEYQVFFRRPLRYGESVDYRISYLCNRYYADVTDECRDDFTASVAIYDWRYEFLFPEGSVLDAVKMYRIIGKHRHRHAFDTTSEGPSPLLRFRFTQPMIGTRLEVAFKLGRRKASNKRLHQYDSPVRASRR